MRRIRIILLLTVFLTTYNLLYSQPTVRVIDTVAQRNAMTYVDVYGTIDFDNTGELIIYFSFNGYLYDIKSILTDPSYGVRSLSADGFKVNFNTFGFSGLIIKSGDYQRITNGILFRIELRGLAYKDSVGYIIPDSIALGGLKLGNAVLQQGKVVVPGIPVYDSFGEGLGYCFPNPFHHTVTIPFYLESSQKIKIVVFSMAGKKIPVHDINLEQNRLFRKESDGDVVPIEDVYSELTAGYYSYIFTPEYWKMSSGLYYVMLITESQVYSRPLAFYKP